MPVAAAPVSVAVPLAVSLSLTTLTRVEADRVTEMSVEPMVVTMVEPSETVLLRIGTPVTVTTGEAVASSAPVAEACAMVETKVEPSETIVVRWAPCEANYG